MSDERPVWAKPGLVALTRSRPEEAVLENCKNATTATPGREDRGCAEVTCRICASVGVS